MIQKRYQRYTSSGIEWTDWKDYNEDNTKLSYLQEEYQWQLKGKLLNEYRVI